MKKALRETQTLRARWLFGHRPPAHYNARPPQTGPITIHCAAKLSAQCKQWQTFIRTAPSSATTGEDGRAKRGSRNGPNNREGPHPDTRLYLLNGEWRATSGAFELRALNWTCEWRREQSRRCSGVVNIEHAVTHLTCT